jgi:hypothetical protein
VRALAASPYLKSLVHLNLKGTGTGVPGACALASVEGWDRLRSLNLDGAGLGTDEVRALLASPLARNLVRLELGGESYRREPSLDVSPELAAALSDPVRLPHLAQLCLRVTSCHPRGKAILAGSESLAWVSLRGGAGLPSYRDSRAPERCPPLDMDV